MEKGLTESFFILDRSGSVRGLESDTIGGFNAMIEAAGDYFPAGLPSPPMDLFCGG